MSSLAQVAPKDPEGLAVAGSFDEVEALVRDGHDSARIAVVGPGASRDEVIAAAAEGIAAGQGPRPVRPHDSGLRNLVVIPTYNESDNLEPIVRAILAFLVTDILVVDDGSPDGTGAIADRLASELPGVSVLHRTGKLGLGTAYVAGFRRAIEAGYDRVFEMDADFSHAPWDLPRLAFAARSAGLVIGSRYVQGGSTVGWNFRRRMLSRSANLYARTILGIPVRDLTAGFRAYDTAVLARMDFDKPTAEGYAFQVQMAWRCSRAGASIREIPIHFIDRLQGQSKMNARIAREAFRLIPALRLGLRD
jgi:dolichol-phosphate mannosyltransferase